MIFRRGEAGGPAATRAQAGRKKMKKTILLFLALFMTVFACGYSLASEKTEIFVQLGHD